MFDTIRKKIFKKKASQEAEYDAESPSIASENPPPTEPFPDGVRVLHDSPGASVDICFVHDLTGNHDSIWTTDGQTLPWPKTLLAPKLDNAHILT